MTPGDDDQRSDSKPGVDPEEFVRRMLQINPEDAAEVRRDAAAKPTTVDVALVHDSVVLKEWTQPSWHEPLDEYEVNGKRYETSSYTKHRRDNGRTLYEVHVAPA